MPRRSIVGLIIFLSYQRNWWNWRPPVFFVLGLAVILSGIGGYYWKFNRFKEQIEHAGERAFRSARTLSHGLDATERLGAPRDNQAGVAESSFPQKNGRGSLHIQI